MKQPWRWFFTRDLKQHLHHKNGYIWDFEKSQILIYNKGFLYVSLGPTWLHVIPSWPIKQFWNQQDHLFYFKGFFVAINVKICERIHSHLQSMCMSKRTMPLAIWFIVITPNSWKSMVIFLMDFIIDLLCFKY